MSTIDPDARGNAIKSALRPAAYVVIVLALLAGPVAAYVMRTTAHPDDAFVGVYLVWLFVVTGGGLFAYYTIRHIAALSIAAYCVAGLGAMMLIFSGGAGENGDKGQSTAVLVPLVPYLVAALLYGLQLRRRYLQNMTKANGVNTDAEVRRVGVSGMVNNVQIFALTLKFVDQQGVSRFFRTHITAIGGFSLGDKIPIRYNAAHPDWTCAIIVSP